MHARMLKDQLSIVPDDAELTNGFLYEHELRSAIDKAGYAGLEDEERALSTRLFTYLAAPAGLYVDRSGTQPIYVVSV